MQELANAGPAAIAVELCEALGSGKRSDSVSLYQWVHRNESQPMLKRLRYHDSIKRVAMDLRQATQMRHDAFVDGQCGNPGGFPLHR